MRCYKWNGNSNIRDDTLDANEVLEFLILHSKRWKKGVIKQISLKSQRNRQNQKKNGIALWELLDGDS